jgi:hypothetical protein
MTRGLGINEQWGKEVDYNLYTTNNHDRLLFASNGCDLHSIVADPRFKDPENGDYSVKADSRALDLGYKNFDMTAFGVVSPHLKEIVKTPQLPEVRISPDRTPVQPITRELALWKGARICEPKGGEFAAFGVKTGTKGIALVYVSMDAEAYGLGFRTGDFITTIDGAIVESIDGLRDAVESAGNRQLMFTLFRNNAVKKIKLDFSDQQGKVNKALIIGIDGCRPDALQVANTPNMDEIWQNGAYSFKARTDEISISGPCWTSMLTGVWHQKHRVVSNDYQQPNLEDYPHFFRRIREEKPGLKCYSVVNWEPIHKILQEGDASYTSTPETDAKVSSEVVRLLNSEDMDVMFVQLDEVDHAGHEQGFSPGSKKYLKAIEKCDRQIGRMLKALEQRTSYNQENWFIIVTTDHGGSEKSHGKNIKAHTTIFYMASGIRVDIGEIEEGVNVVDVAVTALDQLDIPIKEEWNLDGSVVGIK